jgi:hypothetical protein
MAELKPYNLNVIAGSSLSLRDAFALSEMANPFAGIDLKIPGREVVGPVSSRLVRVDSSNSYRILYGFDKDCALQMIQSGDITIDSDKTIDSQLDKAGISITAGFYKLFSNSAKMLAY